MNKRLIMIGMFLIVIPQLKFYAMEPEKNEQPKAPGTEPGVSKVPGSVPDAVKLTTMTGAKVPGGKLVEPVKSTAPVKKTTSFSFGKPVEPVKVVDSSNKGGLDLKETQPENGQDVYDPNRDSFSGVKNESNFNEVQSKNEFEEASKEDVLKVAEAPKTKVDESKAKDETKTKVDVVKKPENFKSKNSPPLKINSLGDLGEFFERLFKNPGGQTKMQRNSQKEYEKQLRETKIKSVQDEVNVLKESITADEATLQTHTATMNDHYYKSYVSKDSADKYSDALSQSKDVSTRIADNKKTLDSKMSELVKLKKENDKKVVLTPEENRQDVIDGVKKAVSDGAVDAALVKLKGYAPKVINAQDVQSLDQHITEIKRLRGLLDESSDEDKAVAGKIDDVIALLDSKSRITTVAYGAKVYTGGAYELFGPSGASIVQSLGEDVPVIK